MKPRVLWFVFGTATGVYASIKARRAAYRLSVPGVIDQAAALGTGWRAFSDELRDGMEAEERRIVTDLYRRAALPNDAVLPNAVPPGDGGTRAVRDAGLHELLPVDDHDKDHT